MGVSVKLLTHFFDRCVFTYYNVLEAQPGQSLSRLIRDAGVIIENASYPYQAGSGRHPFNLAKVAVIVALC